jgi:hypothetical protein
MMVVHSEALWHYYHGPAEGCSYYCVDVALAVMMGHSDRTLGHYCAGPFEGYCFCCIDFVVVVPGVAADHYSETSLGQSYCGILESLMCLLD